MNLGTVLIQLGELRDKRRNWLAAAGALVPALEVFEAQGRCLRRRHPPQSAPIPRELGCAARRPDGRRNRAGAAEADQGGLRPSWCDLQSSAPRLAIIAFSGPDCVRLRISFNRHRVRRSPDCLRPACNDRCGPTLGATGPWRRECWAWGRIGDDDGCSTPATGRLAAPQRIPAVGQRAYLKSCGVSAFGESRHSVTR